MLPKNLKYGSKIESAYARSLRSNIAPQNGTGPYSLGDTIIINIPTRAGLVLVPSESYLKFNVNVTNNANTSNAFRFDSAGSHGCIQRIRCFHGSNQLQDIDNYGVLAKMLFDLQMPTDATYGKYNMLCGTRNDLVARVQPYQPIAVTAAVMAGGALTAGEVTTSISGSINSVREALTASLTAGFSVNQVNSGDRLEGNGPLVAAGATKSATYCLSLISLVGVLCSQNYLPLFEMSSAPLRVEITLVPSILNAFNVTTVNGGVPSMTLSNVEYIGNFLELGDPAIAMIRDSLGGQPLQFVVPDYRNYVYNYPLTNGSPATLAIPIAAKFSSLKALFITCRDQGTGAVTYFPYSSCSRDIADYQFRIGANVFPPKSPNTLPEMFAEVLKAIGSISDINQQPSIEKASYSLVSSLNTGTTLDSATSVSYQYSGSFYIGIDLESYANADKSSLFSGYNTNTEDIYAILTYNAQSGATCSARYDTFANFDCVVICENNTAYVKF